VLLNNRAEMISAARRHHDWTNLSACTHGRACILDRSFGCCENPTRNGGRISGRIIAESY